MASLISDEYVVNRVNELGSSGNSNRSLIAINFSPLRLIIANEKKSRYGKF